MKPTLEERFYSKVNLNGPIPENHPELGPCHLWKTWINRGGYGEFSLGRLHIKAHRLAYELSFGPIPEGMLIDHKCLNRACVNPLHLRLATASQNNQNIGLTKLNTSGRKGVHWDKKRGKWRAQIRRTGKLINLGWFDTPEAAHVAYCMAASEYFGEFANSG